MQFMWIETFYVDSNRISRCREQGVEAVERFPCIDGRTWE